MESKNYEKELENFIEDLITREKNYGRIIYDWAYGAIEFAFKTGLISYDKERELFEKYQILDRDEVIR